MNKPFYNQTAVVMGTNRHIQSIRLLKNHYACKYCVKHGFKILIYSELRFFSCFFLVFVSLVTFFNSLLSHVAFSVLVGKQVFTKTVFNCAIGTTIFGRKKQRFFHCLDLQGFNWINPIYNTSGKTFFAPEPYTR